MQKILHDNPPSRDALDELVAGLHPRPDLPTAEERLHGVCRRLAIDGRGSDAFALGALVNGSPRLGERVVDLVGALLDENDALTLELLDHAARQVSPTRSQGAAA